MKTLTFEGYSDDTFGCGDEDHDNCANGEPISFLVRGAGNSLLVTGQYCPGKATGWQVGIARADDDDDRPAPSWPMRFIPGDRPYTVALVIEAPDDTTVEYVP